MDANTIAAISAGASALTSLLTLIYVILTGRQVGSMRKQVEVSQHQTVVLVKQQEVAQLQTRIQQLQFDAFFTQQVITVTQRLHELWRSATTVNQVAMQGHMVTNHGGVVAFIEAYDHFMAEHGGTLAAVLGPTSEDWRGFLYMNDLFWNAKKSNSWKGFEDFQKEWGSFQDLFDRAVKRSHAQLASTTALVRVVDAAA